jgi:hypothetical protein
VTHILGEGVGGNPKRFTELVFGVKHQAATGRNKLRRTGLLTVIMSVSKLTRARVCTIR